MLDSLPSIDQVLLIPEVNELCDSWSRELVTVWARQAVHEFREELQSGKELPKGPDGKLDPALTARKVKAVAAFLLEPSLKKCVNATGIVIHTNMGRAPLGKRLIKAMEEMLGTYSNLEYDLEAGKRGSRHDHLDRLISAVTGAEAGFIVNNNAAAVLVVLNTLAQGREVIVSRGELIEIGGSFRMPDIIVRGGAIMKEVGTTNKTRVSDYEKALGPDTALLLKVHASNYRIQGFTEEASIEDLVALGKERGVPVMFDLGSGLLVDLAKYGIEGERPVSEYVKTGTDVLTFSGDKLLGGPQAGFIAGRRDIIEDVKKNPMVRALRVGKLTMAAIQQMLTDYLARDPVAQVPVLEILARKPDSIRRAANSLAKSLRKSLPRAEVEVERDEAFAGGGSLPAVPLPTHVVTISLPHMSADQLAAAMRKAPVPVVGRVRSGAFCIDCRTLMPGDPARVVEAAKKAAEV